MAGSSVAVELGPVDVGAAEDLRMLAAALVRAGVDVRVEGWSEPPWAAGPEGGPIGDPSHAPVRLVGGPPSLPVAAATTTIARAAPLAGPLPRAWAEIHASADGIWVPTDAARETFVDAGLEPERLAVVPVAVDTERFSPAAPPLGLGEARAFRFLAVLDWKLRKGWDILVAAFVEEFGEYEDVSLVIKAWSSLGYRTDAIGRMVESVIRGLGRDPRTVPDVHLETGAIPPEALPGLYRAADCLVAPTRAQGWARPVLEAMACGLPVIATATGAGAELMSAELARPVPHALAPPAADALREEPGGGGSWCVPDAAALRRLMREAVTGRDAARERARLAREAMLRTHSVDAVAAGLPDALAAAERTRDRPARARRRPAAPEGARPEDVSFVVQGPVEWQGAAWTVRTCAGIRAFFPGAEIVLSTWVGTRDRDVDCDEVVFSDDPGPVGTNRSNANVNRQLVSTLAGVRASSRPLVVKVRSDLQFHDGTLLEHWGRRPEQGDAWRVFGDRILLPNVFVRRPTYLAPLALHPSDWSCMGTRADVTLLFDVPHMTAEQAHGRPPTTEIGRLWGDPEHMGLTPEQYIWTRALRRVAPELALEHAWDLSPAVFAATEQSFANNLVILDAYLQYGVSGPKYAYAGRTGSDPTLYRHEQWRELYEVHAGGGGDPGAAAAVLDRLATGDWRVSPRDLTALRRGGAAWEAQLLETMLLAPTLLRDPTIGATESMTLASAAIARGELRALLGAR